MLRRLIVSIFAIISLAAWAWASTAWASQGAVGASQNVEETLSRYEKLLKQFEAQGSEGERTAVTKGGTAISKGERTPVSKDGTAISKERLAVARELFDILAREEVTDGVLACSHSTPGDTLRQQVYYWSAEYFYAVQQYEKAAEWGKKALPLCRVGGNRVAEGDCLNLLAITYIRLSDYKQAAVYARQCNELDRKSGNPDNISSSLNTLAAIYMSARQPAEAEKYVLQGIEYSRKAGNKQRMAVLLGMASEVYHQLGNNEKSLDFATKAYEEEQRMGRKDKAAMRQSQMASALIGLGRDAEARRLLEPAIEEFRLDGNRHSLGIACNQMGRLLLKEKRNAEAAKYYDEALRVFVEQGDLYNESHARKGLYEALHETNPALAKQHIDRYGALRDSLYDRETGQLLGKYAALYGNEQLQEENVEVRSRLRLWLAVAIVVAALLLLAAWMVHRRRLRRGAERYASLSSELDTLRLRHRRLQGQYSSVVATGRKAARDEAKDDKDFLAEAAGVIDELLDEGRGVPRLPEIAARLNMSVSPFCRRLKHHTEATPKEFVMQVCMRRACQLLDGDSGMPISEVAWRCGYSDKSNFTRTFKRVLGLTPTEYLHKNSVAENQE